MLDMPGRPLTAVEFHPMLATTVWCSPVLVMIELGPELVSPAARGYCALRFSGDLAMTEPLHGCSTAVSKMHF